MRGHSVAVVTGAGNGIGAAVCRLLASSGWNLVALDRDGDALELLARQLPPSSAVLTALVDVTDSQQLDGAIRDAVERFGRIDGLVACAGINAYFDVMDMSEDDWDSFFAVDLRSVWRCCRAVLPHLLASGAGSIVTISSIHARQTVPGMFPYAAAKAGVEGLTRSLAVELGKAGVRVNAVAPGWTRTQLVDAWLAGQPDPDAALAEVTSSIPLGRIAEPEEVAEVVAFLLDRRSSAITGATVTVDCGLSVQFNSS